MFIYLLLFLTNVSNISLSITISSKGILPIDRNSVALQFYFDIKNENQVPCRVTTKFKSCCSTEEQDCNSMFLYGGHEQNIMPSGRESFIFIYPTVFHHDKRGACYFVIDCKCGRKTKRKILDISFDTKLSSMERKSQQLKRYTDHKVIRDCDSIDEDCLDDCTPVNCALKYTDEKSFYNLKMDRCVRAATCIGTLKNNLPTLAYLPSVNLCRDLEHPVQLQDIYAINNGMSVVTNIPNFTPNYTAVVETNCSTISEKLGFLKDIFSGTLYPSPDGVKVDYSKTCKMIIFSILGYLVCISASILACVCCLRTLACLYKKWRESDKNTWVRLKQRYSGKTKKSRAEFGVKMKDFTPSKQEVKEGLLRDVINRGIPMELRSSVVDVCERIGKDVKWKKRYRVGQVDTPFTCDRDSPMSSSSSVDSLRGNTSVTSEEKKLLK